MDKPKLRVLSWSGGADSTATAILAHETAQRDPSDEDGHIDLIVFAEVIYDKNFYGPGMPASGESPSHLAYINATREVFESWGYPVVCIHDDRDYLDMFNHTVERSCENQGYAYGFAIPGRCQIQRTLKIRCVEGYIKKLAKDYDVISVLGYHAKEASRLAQMEERNRKAGRDREVSLLAKYGLDHADAIALCRRYNMLSPIYSVVDPERPEKLVRSGCFFCPFVRVEELAAMKTDCPRGQELLEGFYALEDRTDLAFSKWNPLTHETLEERRQKVEIFIDKYY